VGDLQISIPHIIKRYINVLFTIRENIVGLSK